MCCYLGGGVLWGCWREGRACALKLRVGTRPQGHRRQESLLQGKGRYSSAIIAKSTTLQIAYEYRLFWPYEKGILL